MMTTRDYSTGMIGGAVFLGMGIEFKLDLKSGHSVLLVYGT